MGQAEPSTGDFVFITSLNPKEPHHEARKLIRSHVMKGKNKGKSYHTRAAAQTSSRMKQQSQIETSGATISPTCLAGRTSVPSRVGTDISLGFEPAETIEVSLLLPVFKFALIAKQAMFSLEPRVLFDQATHTRYRDFLGNDAAYLNAVVYTVHLYFDLAAGLNLEVIRPSKPAYKHLSKSLSLIRERLACEDNDVRLSDPTVMAIMALATHSCMFGHHETASNHLKGIRKIVDLRGGMINFRNNPKLLIEIFRCDLSRVLDSGSQPIFFDNPVVEPFMPYLNGLSAFIPPLVRAYTPSMTSNDMGITDLDLARAWDTIATFCSLLNYASESNRKIPQETLLNTMASVMYRLLHLSYASGTMEEMLRLAILGFCSHIFLQWPEVKFPYRHLSTMYKNCLVDLAVPVAPQTLLWLLSSGYIALFIQSDNHWLQSWLRTTFDLCGINTWCDARVMLKRHLWVDFLHDRLGLKMFEMISQSPII